MFTKEYNALNPYHLPMVGMGGGEFKSHQADLLASISEPHRTNEIVLAIIHRYGWATKWHK